jgi:murein tripeptide amidase MpaA
MIRAVQGSGHQEGRRRRTTVALFLCLATAALALASLAYFPATAGAELMRSADAVARDCQAERLAGHVNGVAVESWTAPARGFVTAALEGGIREPDWDLAIFERGEAIAASTSFGAAERATVWVDRGDRLAIQACRRLGADPTVPLALDLYETPPPGPSDERFTLEEVAISGPADVRRLERLGLDVTHELSSSSAVVATYSSEQREELSAAGFESQPVVRDLVAADAADRAAEQRAAAVSPRSPLPTGRETYRVYEDYTTEMKQLAESSPDLVREVVIGQTFEGLPIQGIEIAADVNSTTDGRPVYLNMGLHHAREWPSGEYPMEFAHQLVAGYGTDARITDLLNRVRVFVLPVINVDGFLASRSFGTSPLDDDSAATAGMSAADQAAYKRKNCRPTVPGSESVPCPMRTFSGVDLNRNYGYYWGGPGSSSDVTSQGYRGTAPFSEPESEAVHQFTSRLHPMVFITNHTFTDDGKWLRQPGFDDVIATAPEPDETNMRTLGDAMAAATGWTSELGYETLGDITGATEDWNYFAQGTYGYTPEARGPNFHANYADMVVTEYLGDAAHPGLGVGEAFLRAGEAAANPALHSVLEGSAPPGATLGLSKQFDAPTCQPNPSGSECSQPPGLSLHEVLDTSLAVADSGSYEWHVNPSSRPLVFGEVWTMSCQVPGGPRNTVPIAVARGERVSVDWTAGCEQALVEPGHTGSCKGKPATFLGTTGGDTGQTALVGTEGPDVIVGQGGGDEIRSGGGKDLVCAGGGNDEVSAGAASDSVGGGSGRDELRGSGGRDRLRGGAGRDVLGGGGGRDRCRGGPGKDVTKSC